MKLCDNCKGIGEKTGSWPEAITAYPVGHEKGTQRDPYHETVDLCIACRQALSSGNFHELQSRYRTEP